MLIARVSEPLGFMARIPCHFGQREESQRCFGSRLSMTDVACHCEEGSDEAISFVWRDSQGDCFACWRRLAMTRYLSF